MSSWLQKKFPEWFPIEKLKTEYSHLEVIRQGDKLLLNASHANYSFGSLHEVFRDAFQQLNPDYEQLNNVLILGFGAGSVAWILQKENRCPCHITGVEIDEKVIALANKYFQLSNLENLNIHISDASDFLSEKTRQYDLIVVDLFLDHRTPERFLTAGFLKDLHVHLQPQGIILFNYLQYDFKAQNDIRPFEEIFAKTFQDIRELTFNRKSKNVVFTGRK